MDINTGNLGKRLLTEAKKMSSDGKINDKELSQLIKIAKNEDGGLNSDKANLLIGLKTDTRNVQILKSYNFSKNITFNNPIIETNFEKPKEEISQFFHNFNDVRQSKYEKIKSLIKNPAQLSSFKDLLYKVSKKPELIDNLLDQTIKNLSSLKEKPFGLDNAKKIVGIVNKKIPYVPDKRDSLMIVPKGLQLEWQRYQNNILRDGHDFSNNRNIENIANYSESISTGNCAELAAVAAVDAKKQGAGRVEIFSILNENHSYNHAFVIVNRDKNSKIDDQSTWGNKSILLDPWTKESYPATDFYKHRVMNNLTPRYEGEYNP